MLSLGQSTSKKTELPTFAYSDCENVDECFSHFTAEMFTVLSRADFHSLRRSCLENINKLCGIEFPSDLRRRIAHTYNLDDLFDILCDTPYWNWMNIKMITKMAIASNLPAAIQLIQQYKKKIISIKLKNFISQFTTFSVSYTTKSQFKEKFNKDFADLTLGDMVNHWSDLEKIFNVGEPNLLLDRLLVG